MTMNASIHLGADVEVHYGPTDIGGYITIENATPGGRTAATVHGTNARLREIAERILAAVPAPEPEQAPLVEAMVTVDQGVAR